MTASLAGEDSTSSMAEMAMTRSTAVIPQMQFGVMMPERAATTAFTVMPAATPFLRAAEMIWCMEALTAMPFGAKLGPIPYLGQEVTTRFTMEFRDKAPIQTSTTWMEESAPIRLGVPVRMTIHRISRRKLDI